MGEHRAQPVRYLGRAVRAANSGLVDQIAELHQLAAGPAGCGDRLLQEGPSLGAMTSRHRDTGPRPRQQARHDRHLVGGFERKHGLGLLRLPRLGQAQRQPGRRLGSEEPFSTRLLDEGLAQTSDRTSRSPITRRT